MSKLKLNISDSIILFIIPIFAYLVSYLYKLGYYNFFSIPVQWLKIEISDLVIGLYLPLGIIVNFVFCYFFDTFFSSSFIENAFLFQLLPFSLAFTLIVKDILNLFYIGLFFSISSFIVTLMLYIKDMKKSIKPNISLNGITISNFFKYIKLNSSALLIFLIFSLLFSYFFSYIKPYRKEYYYTFVDTNSKYIVLDFYNDKAICSPLTSDNKITKKIILFDINQDNSLSFDNIGPIKFNENINN